ncbi:MAG: hypothetical protein ACRDTH_07200 [Pseudonocardiaceae bacterium]
MAARRRDDSPDKRGDPDGRHGSDVDEHAGKPDDKLIRHALCRWAFNRIVATARVVLRNILSALRGVQGHTLPVKALRDAEVLRRHGHRGAAAGAGCAGLPAGLAKAGTHLAQRPGNGRI